MWFLGFSEAIDGVVDGDLSCLPTSETDSGSDQGESGEGRDGDG